VVTQEAKVGRNDPRPWQRKEIQKVSRRLTERSDPMDDRVRQMMTVIVEQLKA
jgi:hypothetical protein